MLRGPELEHLPNLDAPNVKQIEHLAAQLILFAQRHGKLKTVQDKNEDKVFRVTPAEIYSRPDIFSGAPFGYLVKNTCAALIKRRRDDTWSMRYFDAEHAIELGSQRGGSRSVYTFEWDDEVRVARRKARALPDTNPEEMIDVVDTMHFRDDDAIVPYLELEMEMVTANDLELLNHDVSALIQQVDTEQRKYKEPRLDRYMEYFAK